MGDNIVGTLPTIDYEDVKPKYIEKDYVDHRQVYIGLHHHKPGDEKPTSRKKTLKLSNARPPKPFRWDNGKKKIVVQEDSGSEKDGSGDQFTHSAPASERVKFILGGGEEEKTTNETPQLFTELEELFVYLDGNTEWKETARWYKYEEDVEEGGDRWSKPHVATLSLYSLFQLRSSLMAGTVVLDMEATTLDEIADNVLDNLITCNKLDKGFRQKVRETLLCKHRHHRDAGFRRNLSNIISRKSTNALLTASNGKLSKNFASNGNDLNLLTATGGGSTQNGNGGTVESGCNTPQNKYKMFRNYSQPAFPSTQKHVLEHSISTGQQTPQLQTLLPQQQSHLTYHSHPASDDEHSDTKTPGFLKRLPSNAEASNILVGEVNFLDKPITAFVRLACSCIIGDLTEIPIPTRFLFVMLGPAVSHGRYHEIGRAISTLMADEVFHDVVYRAKSRDDLIAGIDEFLEQVTVLPPGEWDPSIRLDPRVHNLPKVSRRTAMDQRQDTVIEHGEGVSEGDDTSESEKSNAIRFTSRTFGGLVHDMRVWKSRMRDIKDGINLKCLGAVFFIYLLLIAAIATIGEHNWTSSDGHMGTREHLLSLFITGILFSMFGGQPLLVISLELPLSIFDGLLFSLCKEYSIDYLSFRLWIGLWTVVFLLIFIALDFSQYLRYITRFTLEIFVVIPPLVLLFYGFIHMCIMVRAYAELPGTFVNQTCLCIKETNSTLPNVTFPTNSTVINGPLFKIIEEEKNIHFRDCIAAENFKLKGTACIHGVYPFTSILTVSTIVLIVLMTSFQHLGYLPKQVNQFFHDYAAIIVVVIISSAANQYNINIRYLQIPKSLSPDMVHRSTWFVHPLGRNEVWTIFLGLIPAIFLTLFIFVEQQLTGCYINNKNKILKKGHGYHLDIFVIAVGVLLSSLLGLPFCVASIFISIIHVQALTVKDSVDDFIGCSMSIKEQRLTSFFVYLLIILTPTLRPILRYIPFPVLYGLLIIALFKTFNGVQFVKRFTLLFMPKEKQPDIVYLRQVPLISVNIFTLVQVVVTVILCLVRGTVATVVFPVIMICIVMVRCLLEKILPLADILAMDESVPAIRAPWRSCRNKSRNGENLENGILLADETHEDVLPDHNKDIERVNISEELSKTATWRQLTYNENSPHCNNSPANDIVDGKRRRKKRSRGSIQKSKDGDDTPIHKTSISLKPPVDDSEFLELKSVEHFEGKGFYEDQKDHSVPTIDSLDSRSQKQIDPGSTHRNKSSSWKSSEDRGSVKRQRSKDRGELLKRNSSKERNSSKRHDSSERNPMKRQSSHDRKHKTNAKTKPTSTPVEETPLPPWEQPYLSPPRKDLGLLHAHDEPKGIHFDPACSRDEVLFPGDTVQPEPFVETVNPNNSNNALDNSNENEMKIPSIDFKISDDVDCTSGDTTQQEAENNRRICVDDSGDAGDELDAL